jgi:hypothetical protein
VLPPPCLLKVPTRGVQPVRESGSTVRLFLVPILNYLALVAPNEQLMSLQVCLITASVSGATHTAHYAALSPWLAGVTEWDHNSGNAPK